MKKIKLFFVMSLFFILTLSGCTNKIDKLREELESQLNLEGQRINYCQEDFDCGSICLSACPGSFMVYNQEESSEKLIDLYREYEKQVIYKNKERPICDADFCEFKIELLCQNGKCRLENDGFMGSCINCK